MTQTPNGLDPKPYQSPRELAGDTSSAQTRPFHKSIWMFALVLLLGAASVSTIYYLFTPISHFGENRARPLTDIDHEDNVTAEPAIEPEGQPYE